MLAMPFPKITAQAQFILTPWGKALPIRLSHLPMLKNLAWNLYWINIDTVYPLLHKNATHYRIRHTNTHTCTFFASQPADSFTFRLFFLLMSHYFLSGVSRLLVFVLPVKANRMLSLCSSTLFISVSHNCRHRMKQLVELVQIGLVPCNLFISQYTTHFLYLALSSVSLHQSSSKNLTWQTSVIFLSAFHSLNAC